MNIVELTLLDVVSFLLVDDVVNLCKLFFVDDVVNLQNLFSAMLISESICHVAVVVHSLC